MKRLLILILFLFQCSSDPIIQESIRETDPTRIVYSSSGIVLYHCALIYNSHLEEDAWIANIGSESVFVRTIWRGAFGETTIDTNLLPTNGLHLRVPYITRNHGFYLYSGSSDRAVLGYISGECPEP